MATWTDIATAAKATLDGISGFPTTVIRKSGDVYSRDTLPLCVIALATESSDPTVTAFGIGATKPTIGKVYTVAFSIYRVNPGNIETGIATNPDLVLSAKRALHTITVAAVPAVWQTDLVEDSAWEGVKFRDGAEESSFAIRYRAAEARNG